MKVSVKEHKNKLRHLEDLNPFNSIATTTVTHISFSICEGGHEDYFISAL